MKWSLLVGDRRKISRLQALYAIVGEDAGPWARKLHREWPAWSGLDPCGAGISAPLMIFCASHQCDPISF